MDITIGSDVEFFAQDAKGHIVSAEGIIPGTKQEPVRFVDGDPFFATQLDNVLAEGNIPPARTSREFALNIETLRSHLDSLVRAANGGSTVAKAAHLFAPEQLMSEHAQTFGCDPSFNAWTDTLEEVNPTNPLLRGAGFHIHIGYDKPSMEKNRELIKYMDLFLGVPSVLLDDQAHVRRAGGYGAAGNFRHQNHGVEYRTLSSRIAASPDLLQWAFDQTVKAYSACVRDGFIKRNPELADGSLIQRVINESDFFGAESIVRKYDIVMP